MNNYGGHIIMKYKLVLLAICLIVVFLSIANVSASDTNDVVLANTNDEMNLTGDYVYCDGDLNSSNSNGQVLLSTSAPAGNESLNESDKVTTNKANTIVSANYDEIGRYVIATLKDGDGKAIEEAKIGFVMPDGVKYVLSDADGQAKYSTAGLDSGNYKVRVAFLGNDRYDASNKVDVKFSITKIATMLVVEYDAGSKNLVATVKDVNGNLVSGIKVGFAIDGVKYITTDARGQAKYSTADLAEEEYTASVMAYGNDLYKNSNKERVTFSLIKDHTMITAPDVVTAYNSSKNLVAVLRHLTGEGISNAEVTIKLGNLTKTLITDKNGQVSLTTKGLAPNKYVATITFAGNDAYKPSSRTAKVIINDGQKRQAKVYLRNALYFVLDMKTVQVTLWDANNNPIAGKTVYLSLDEYGSKYSGVTNANGDAYIRIGVGFGNHPATVTFEGDDQYGADGKTGSVRVIKKTPSLMLPGEYTKFKSTDTTKTLKVYLWDRSIPLLMGTKVLVKINGRNYVGSIDDEGIASININLNRAGVYDVELYYTGNTAYNAVRKTTKITLV